MIFRALTCVAFLVLSISHSGIPAAALTFTWDSAGASPSLGGTAFTADRMTLANYLFAVAQPSGLTPEHFIQPITSFQQSGSTVGVSGLGSSFGLYFDIAAVFSTVGGPHFDSLNVRLLADRNADNGTVSSTLAGVGFSNPAGVANDFQLAHGTLIAAADGTTIQLVNNGVGAADLAPVPEPTTLALLGTTMTALGLAAGRRRQRRK